jgi:hypothetical protein
MLVTIRCVDEFMVSLQARMRREIGPRVTKLFRSTG